MVMHAEYTQVRVLFYISLRVRSSTSTLLPNADYCYQLPYIKKFNVNTSLVDMREISDSQDYDK